MRDERKVDLVQVALEEECRRGALIQVSLKEGVACQGQLSGAVHVTAGRCSAVSDLVVAEAFVKFVKECGGLT